MALVGGIFLRLTGGDFLGKVTPGVEFGSDRVGLDHGAGHSLLLLCDAKIPRDKKSKEFKALGHYLCNVSRGLL
jgi:hypothetical protein